MMNRLIACAALLATIGPSVACDVKVGKEGDVSVDVAHGQASDNWSRTYHVMPGGHVDVTNLTGLMTVAAAAGPDVEVVATREVRAANDEAAKEVLARAQMVEQVSPDRVTIEARGAEGNGFRSRLTVRINVRVPPGLNVAMKTQNGGTRIENVQGAFEVESTNGQIVGQGIAGSLRASTVNGPIRVEIVSLNGDSRVTTVNGPVELAVAAGLNANLEASVTNGAVLIADSLPLTATERGPQRVVGRINAGGPTIIAQTTNGAVRVRSGTLDTFEGMRGRRGRRGPPPS